jgi:spore coat polysaccharide biosynthesis protein SpsF
MIQFNLIKNDNPSNNILLIFSPYPVKYILYKFPFDGDKIQLRDTQNNFYFVENKITIFEEIKSKCIDKNVSIIAISKGGHVALEFANYISNTINTNNVSVFLFNPMLILDRTIIVDHNILFPQNPISVDIFTKKYKKNIEDTYKLLYNKTYRVIYTYSKYSMLDNLNFNYFKKYIDFFCDINIKSHNCLYPFIHNVDHNIKVDHDEINVGNYSKEDINNILQFFNNKLLSLDTLINSTHQLLNNVYKKVIDNKHVTLIIQARMSSTRLPGKILLEVNGTKLLDIFIQRVQQSKELDSFIIATTMNECDDVIVEYCKQNNYKWMRGSETNVFDRFKQCCNLNNITHVCRVTSDNPLFDYEYLDFLIREYKKNNYDYLKPIGGIHGVIEGELFNMDKLKKHCDKFDDTQNEHVTKFIYDNPSLFNIKYILYSHHKSHSLFDKKYHFSYIRLTLDTNNDFIFISKIINNCKNTKMITINTILQILENNLNWIFINNDNNYIENNKKLFLNTLEKL